MLSPLFFHTPFKWHVDYYTLSIAWVEKVIEAQLYGIFNSDSR
jgi:hypothetical protein